MRRRLSLSSGCSLFFLAVAILTPRSSAQDIFVTPVANAPFSAVVNIERTIVQKDGSLVEIKNFREIGRDAKGRIHNEARMAVPASSTQTPQLWHVHIFDPQTRVSIQIDPRKKVFWTTVGNHPPATEPPSMRFSAPEGESLPNEFAREEDLGTRDFDGIEAHGIRQTQPLPADTEGKEIDVVDEYWYSADLRINLFIKHSDPRTGTKTMTVTQITRTEPDPAFFEVPEGYKQIGK
jgi:hypothetical protein